MPLSHFKQAIGHFQVAMYDEKWKQSSIKERGPNSGIWSYAVTNPEDQQVVLSLEYMNPKMVPALCQGEQQKNYDVYVHDSEGALVKQFNVSPQNAYGQVTFDKLKAGQYTIKVRNDSKMAQKDSKVNFDVRAYSNEKEVKLQDFNKVVKSELKEASEKNKKNYHYNVNKKLGQVESVFFDKNQNLLTIMVDKDPHTERDAKI